MSVIVAIAITIVIGILLAGVPLCAEFDQKYSEFDSGFYFWLISISGIAFVVGIIVGISPSQPIAIIKIEATTFIFFILGIAYWAFKEMENLYQLSLFLAVELFLYIAITSLLFLPFPSYHVPILTVAIIGIIAVICFLYSKYRQ